MLLLDELLVARQGTGDDLYVMLTTQQIDGAIAAIQEMNELHLKLDRMAAMIIEQDRRIADLASELDDRESTIPVP